MGGSKPDAGKLPGKFRAVGGGIRFLRLVSSILVKFRDETLLRGRGCNNPNFRCRTFLGFLGTVYETGRDGPRRAERDQAEPRVGSTSCLIGNGI